MPQHFSPLSEDNQHWITGQFTRQLMTLLSNDLTLVVDGTWADDHTLAPALKWVQSNPQRHAVILTTYDPPMWPWDCPQHENIHVVHAEGYWMYYCAEHMERREVGPVFEYPFLCYMRKPRDERVALYDRLSSLRGIATIGTKHFDFNKGIDYTQTKEDNSPDDALVGCDTVTLGNQQIWDKCFLNICSETEFESRGSVFISEKSYKPILGKRPFIHYGNPQITEVLQDWGFKTFNDEFDYHPSTDPACTQQDQLNSIVAVAKKLQTADLNQLYNSMLPKINHNYNNFDQISNHHYDQFLNDCKSLVDKS